jgi:hypothetical protein
LSVLFSFFSSFHFVIPKKKVRVDVPKELCFHFNEYRSINPNSTEHRGVKRVPPMVIHGFYKNVQEPSVGEEGFTSVVRLGLEHVELLGSEDDKQLMRSFVL